MFVCLSRTLGRTVCQWAVRATRGGESDREGHGVRVREIRRHGGSGCGRNWSAATALIRLARPTQRARHGTAAANSSHPVGRAPSYRGGKFAPRIDMLSPSKFYALFIRYTFV